MFPWIFDLEFQEAFVRDADFRSVIFPATLMEKRLTMQNKTFSC